MIELELHTGEDTQVWSDSGHRHAIEYLDEARAAIRYGSEPGFHIHDESGELGAYPSLAAALDYLQTSQVWGEVSLAPANRLARNIAEGPTDEIGHFLLEYLADYGPVGIDAQALANLVFARVGGDEEAWG